MALTLNDTLDLADGNAITIESDASGFLRVFISQKGVASSKLLITQSEMQKLIRKLNGANLSRSADLP